jgi:HEAT repeat protein
MDEEKRSQPERRIRGGAIRKSTRVDRGALAGVAARERVERLLLGHDFDALDRSLKEITEADYPVVRLIAQEGAATNLEPAIRYKAIAVLARWPQRENMNLLTDLTSFGEDFYVRGHALMALGTTGHYTALPAIARHIEAEERFEQLAARRAVEMLVRLTSAAGVRAHLRMIDDAKLRSRIAEIVERAERAGVERAERPTATQSRKPR